MEDVRAILQITMRRFGMLNKNCCSVDDQDVSQVQSHILYELARIERPSMQQVAETIGMDITTFSRQIQTLVKMELVEKRQSREDKRMYHLYLTEKGEKLEAEINQQMLHYLTNIFSNLSEKESDEVVDSLKILNAAMSKSSMCCKPLY
ncbi:MarR family winged helix-turn-helix transcriptional regulator [Sutcliffiella horikoshii]|uniref:MarR family winged helix-turn-helix transcriptional regulator n=1 Tax=Sutcliffiella horikoshii TaxID=79883 RepID=UPI001F3BE9E6|nr:MarR family transcriptional regulator [Sutcliffiella horikoshii]MCG1022388.1 MarR family transcriptional regulator [Sutcliffiella horikoshii]